MKALLVDIETSPLLVYTWGIYDQNIGLNQIVEDWSVLAYCAKWLDTKKLIYADNRKAKNVRDDKQLLKGIWKLLDQADVVITQNGVEFDSKKLNARFAIQGMKPPSSYKHIDTRKIAKKHFKFTSNKLEYFTDVLGTKYKKLKHDKFPGQELWNECLKKNPEAWKEMEVYNKYDVLSLEEVYRKLIPWDNAVNFNVYRDDETSVCTCGSTKFTKNGYFYSSTGKYQRYSCANCGSEFRSRKNDKAQQELVGTKR